MDIFIKLFFIFQFMYSRQHYFSNAEPIAGTSVRRAHENEFPFVVAIGRNYIEGEDGHICTGALISRRHVLTSAHCLDEGDLETLQVSIGSVDLLASEKFSVSSSKIYDDWADENNQPQTNEDDDIAIITLSRPVDNPRIVPAKISPLSPSSAVGKSFTIAGWGVTENGRKSRFLRTVPVTAKNLQHCSDIVSRVMDIDYTISPVYICTQASPPAVAKCGDSGGPLFTSDHEIVGINDAECSEKFRGEDIMNLQLGIHNYRDFIADILRH